MAREIPKGYEKAENQEFESSGEAYKFIKNYCNKCKEMKAKEKCSISKELRAGLEDGFSYWADALVALEPENICLERKVHCFDYLKCRKL
jgi:hypothetical protein